MTRDNRPGFYEGRETRGFVARYTHRPWYRRKTWRGVIERHFVTWEHMASKSFHTEQEAEEWVAQALAALDGATRDRKYVTAAQEQTGENE